MRSKVEFRRLHPVRAISHSVTMVEAFFSAIFSIPGLNTSFQQAEHVMIHKIHAAGSNTTSYTRDTCCPGTGTDGQGCRQIADGQAYQNQPLPHSYRNTQPVPHELGACHTTTRLASFDSVFLIEKPSHVPFFTLGSTFAMALFTMRHPALRIASRRYPMLRVSSISRAAFSTTPRWQIRTKEMTEEHFKDLKVNQARLMEDIHHTCQWGIGERWGE